MKGDELLFLLIASIIVLYCMYGKKLVGTTTSQATQEMVQAVSEPSNVSEYLARYYPNAL
jgi:hypothetical protein